MGNGSLNSAEGRSFGQEKVPRRRNDKPASKDWLREGIEWERRLIKMRLIRAAGPEADHLGPDSQNLDR